MYEDERSLPFVDELSRAEHDVRQRRLDELPARDGSDGLGEARRQAHAYVLHQDLLEGLRRDDVITRKQALNSYARPTSVLLAE